MFAPPNSAMSAPTMPFVGVGAPVVTRIFEVAEAVPSVAACASSWFRMIVPRPSRTGAFVIVSSARVPAVAPSRPIEMKFPPE